MPYPAEEVLGISPFVRLRRESNKVVISHVPHLQVGYGVLTAPQTTVFCLIDGQRTVGEVITAVSQLFGLSQEESAKYLFKLLDYITPDGKMLVRNARMRRVASFDPTAFIVPAQTADLSSRLEAPVSMMLQPTHACQADCIYCYACRRPIPRRDHLGTSRILELLEEMAAQGIWQVNFCGGDPFCQSDFLTILGRALKLGLVADISTKAYLSRNTVHELANMGLDYIQVSIDAAEPEKGDFIFGRRGQYNRVLKTLRNLLETNIFVRTNSIIVKQNLDDLEAIILKLKGLGVKEMKFSPAFRSMHTDNLRYLLNADEIARFESDMTLLTERYTNDDLTIFHSTMPDPSNLSNEQREQYWFKERPICSSGRSSMIVTPDGKVSICEEVPQTSDLIVGDVKRMSLAEVWHSPTMKALAFPAKDKFEGTPCAGCEQYDPCVLHKGHCFKDALKAYGRVFTVNPFCPSAPRPIPRLY